MRQCHKIVSTILGTLPIVNDTHRYITMSKPCVIKKHCVTISTIYNYYYLTTIEFSINTMLVMYSESSHDNFPQTEGPF